MKFKGEEEIPVEELQKGFFSCMDKSDAYVICNPNSYEGFMVSIEFGYATNCIRSGKGPLRTIYFTNTPLGYDKFNSDIELSFDTFLENLYRDPSYQNELAYFSKFKGEIEYGYYDEEDFYDDLKQMYGKVLLLQTQGSLFIGLESLLNKSKDARPHKEINLSDADDELEL